MFNANSHVRAVSTVKIEDLKPRQRNPRTHSKKQIRQIANSIAEFGFVNPVLIDGDGRIIAGHGRVEAAKLAGLTEIPTLCVSHLSATQIRAYVIADNRLAENAGWDSGLLALELKELTFDLDFKIELTGFDGGALDMLLGNSENADEETDEPVQIDASKPAVTRLGDLWRIGRHFVLCADATKSESYDRLLNGELAQMVFTDPPYNVRIDGHVSGLGKAKHEEFEMASGEMSEPEFEGFLESVCKNLAAYSSDGSLHYLCMDWRHMGELQKAASASYAEFKNLCVWTKTNGGMGSFYRSQHELVFVYKNGHAPHINNIELGKNGRYRTNVWTYPGVNTFGKNRDAELAMHPTVKPIKLVADAILDASERNGIVLDAFGGSGTTLIAAEKTGRRGFALEISPHYVDTILKRLAKTTRCEPTLYTSGESFESVRRWRQSGIDD